MSLSINDAQVFSAALKRARKKQHLTQAECGELLEYSLSFQKDLERCRCSPSIENFYHICRTLNISADDCVFSESCQSTNPTYNELLRLLPQCDESSLRVLTATATAMLNEKSKASPWILDEQKYNPTFSLVGLYCMTQLSVKSIYEIDGLSFSSTNYDILLISVIWAKFISISV